MKHTALIINDLCVRVFLGVTARERRKKQEVRWTIHCALKPSSQKKYLCYEQVAKKVILYSTSRPFHLMESMADYCFKQLKRDFPQIKKLKLHLHKVNPPVSKIKGGVFYELGDFS